MLAKKYRLSGSRESFRGAGRKTNFFSVRARRNDLAFSRFAVVVPKKVHKSAVRRNKLRRMIYDIIRLSKLHESPGNDFLLFVLPAAADASREELEKDLRQAIDARMTDANQRISRTQRTED